VATQKPEPNAKQKAAVERITKIDPEAMFEVIGGWVKATYIPAWERVYNDRAIPNPTKIVFALDESGRVSGWGFTSAKNFPALVKRCPFGADLTTPEQMQAVLKTRTEMRQPRKAEAEVEAKPKAEAKKPTPKRRAAPKSGVQVATK
jgi:hypothetical protein